MYVMDRRLYLPKSWAEDSHRRTIAKVPESIEFATKPELARQMLESAVKNGVPSKWVVADEVYGACPQFRRFCESNGLGYVLTVRSNAHLDLNGTPKKLSEHLADIPKRKWRRISCGPGMKGEREYDWAYFSWVNSDNPKFSRGLLVRRSISDPTDVAYFFTHAPKWTKLKTLVRVAGSRWSIEECFEQSKGETGLDEYEVRSWVGWHRHITLSMLAHATLSVIRSRVHQEQVKKPRPNKNLSAKETCGRRPTTDSNHSSGSPSAAGAAGSGKSPRRRTHPQLV